MVKYIAWAWVRDLVCEDNKFYKPITIADPRKMMQNPKGKKGAALANEELIGANISSAHVLTIFSSIPLQSYQNNNKWIIRKKVTKVSKKSLECSKQKVPHSNS